MLRAFFAGLVFLFSGAATASPVPAQTETPEVRQTVPVNSARADGLQYVSGRLLALLRGEIAPQDYFAENFLQDVPAQQFEQQARSILAAYGQPEKLEQTQRESPISAGYILHFEKAAAHVSLVIDPETLTATGLRFAKFELRSDSFAEIQSDFAALPGDSAFAVMELPNGAPPRLIAGHRDDKQIAVASTFKLYVLAELSNQIASGKRRWSDVTVLNHRSYSSLATRGWPKNSPATLETLALQMIAVSDNSASDTLLHFLGRAQVENRLRAIGHSAPERTLPLLTTVEAFVLKGDEKLRTRYLRGNEAERRKLLSSSAHRLKYEDVDPLVYSSPQPKYIGEIEWFASPRDIGQLLNHIRRSRDPRALKILGVNAGVAEGRRGDWRYLGYKGGSEPGVISMSYLLLSRQGRWYAVTASWNNSDKAVNESRFSELLTRLLDQSSKL